MTNLTIYRMWKEPAHAPRAFLLIELLLQLEGIPYGQRYAPDKAARLSDGKLHPDYGFVIVSEEGMPPYVDRLMYDIYELTRWIEANGLKRV